MKKGSGFKIKCEHCDKEFFMSPNRLKKSKTYCCSRQCATKLSSKRYLIQRICTICNKSYDTVKRKNIFTCSKECLYKKRSLEYSNDRNPNALKLSEYDRFFYNRAKDIISKCKRNNLECDINYKDLIQLYEKQNGKCFYTNIEILPVKKEKSFDTLSFDRLDSNKGYTKENIVICLLCINYLKSNFRLEDIEGVFEKIIKNRI